MRKKIGELLVESGAVTEEKVRNALGHQRAYGRGERLGRILVSMGLVSPAAVARALATQFDMPFVELPEVAPEVIALIPIDFQSEHRVIPFRVEAEGRSERLHIAVEDPADLHVVDELRFQLRKTVRIYVAASDDIDNALSLARGEKLEVVEAIALEEDSGEVLSIEQDTPGMVSGGRFDPNAPKAPPPPGASPSLLEWELPEVPAGKSKPPPPVPTPLPIPPPPPAPPRAAAPPPPPPPQPPPAPAQAASSMASSDFLDALLGPTPKPPPPPPPVPDPTTPRVPVVVFGGAAQGVKPPPPPPPPPEFSDADLQVLDSIEKLAQGEEAPLDSEKVKPARMVAALIRLLIKKGVIQELEFLEELARK